MVFDVVTLVVLIVASIAVVGAIAMLFSQRATATRGVTSGQSGLAIASVAAVGLAWIVAGDTIANLLSILLAVVAAAIAGAAISSHQT